jgi:tryptophan halogenase
MELFRERARVVTYKDGLFLEPSWLAVYFGQRVMPKGCDPRLDALAEADVDAQLARVHGKIALAAERMPGHEEFLRSYCPASPPAARSGAGA